MTPPRPSSIENVRVLLLQARNTAEMEHQEQECFLERCRIRPEQLTTVNVVHEPLHAGLLDDIDTFMIGGAGEYSAKDNPPWMPDVLHFVRQAAERNLPTFGSCWGHQLIARAFGGRVIHDPDCAELGSGAVKLTEAGKRDPLFSALPPRFRANMGHHDRVVDLPANAVELAFNDSQRNQAFRLANKPVYGTQFHTELDAARERERIIAYREYYRQDLPTDEKLQQVIDNLAETTEVDRLLHEFLLTFAADQPRQVP